MTTTWKIVLFSFILWSESHAATTSIDLTKLNTQVTRKNGYLPPPPTVMNTKNVNSTTPATPSKTYISKTTRSIDDFNTHPQLKATKASFGSSHARPLFTSYAPPPSGTFPYKNYQLPINSDTLKIPFVVPKNEYTKHPGFDVTSATLPDNNDSAATQMLMIEEPPSLLLQPQHNRTIEAAKILATTLLEASGEAPLEPNKTPVNSSDVYIVKSQKKAYIIPTHLRKEISKPSAVETLYPMREQFEKAYTINQFIFVIKPEKINFLNKLV
ncbi:uncharacterized protein LOC109614046 [Musca domestica]|uniref:Uncharacterized protein LOC109614046 n=1 Tax=Musca domestica TaxID=7370 RepID=A0A9J7DKJ8_MUSDO|nr:uncharacterized protein LOC109614046 [Musca domestica]